jgi:hypothetical protein
MRKTHIAKYEHLIFGKIKILFKFYGQLKQKLNVAFLRKYERHFQFTSSIAFKVKSHKELPQRTLIRHMTPADRIRP